MAKKIVLLLLLSIQSISNVVHAHQSPKIILHQDINRTIIAEDLVEGKSVDVVLINALAEKYCDHWSSNVLQPISYADYIKTHLLPGSKTDPVLKKARNQKIAEFIDYLQTIHHAFYNKVQEKFQKLRTKLASHKSIIFPSFYREIEYLNQLNIPYSLVLRTFGKDLDRVIEEIHNNISSEFFDWRGIFKNGYLELTALKTKEVVMLHTTAELYDFLKKHGNIALQDDWKTWNQHHETQEFGKLFPIDTNDGTVITLFADDNADPSNGIVNARHPKTNAILNIKELIEHNNICVVDMLSAIEDDEYFVKQLQSLLLHHNNF